MPSRDADLATRLSVFLASSPKALEAYARTRPDFGRLLVDAKNWSSHFPPEDQVAILGGEPELTLGIKFHRLTVAYPMSPIVTEFVPGRRLAWSTTVDRDETGSTAYHGWVITPTDEGCHVVRGDAARRLLP